jgi:hypothetical protein
MLQFFALVANALKVYGAPGDSEKRRREKRKCNGDISRLVDQSHRQRPLQSMPKGSVARFTIS